MDQLLEFISHHWALVSLFVLAFIWLIIEEGRHQGVGGARLSTQMATKLINQEHAIVIDLRDSTAFATGHIVNSTNISYSTMSDKMGKFESYKNKPIILVCAAGQNSLRAMHQLKKQGFEKVYILGGGLAAWKRANLPVVKSKGS